MTNQTNSTIAWREKLSFCIFDKKKVDETFFSYVLLHCSDTEVQCAHDDKDIF